MWKSIAGDVRVVYEMITRPTPYRLLLDLSEFDPNEAVKIDIAPELVNDISGDGRWVETESHKLQMLRPEPGPMILNVDDQAVGPRAVAIIEPMWGPWRARVNYTQVYGTSKTVRFLVW